MKDIRCESYRQRGRDGDPNAKRIHLGPITIWFSYDTPIAFAAPHLPQVCVRENDWGPTTGKHLNTIDGGDRETRVPSDEFEALFQQHVMRYFFPRDLDANCPAPIVADWLQDRGLEAAAKIVRETGATV